MPRAKKDGRHINCYVDRALVERLEEYAQKKDRTLTATLERILKQFFEEHAEND